MTKKRTKKLSKCGKKKKLKWEPFEITRVKLNPDQAVLSCCDNAIKVRVWFGYQCDPVGGPDCGSGSGGYTAVS